MKKITLLYLALLTCFSISFAQLQVDVNVTVVDQNGVSLDGVYLQIYPSFCDSSGQGQIAYTTPNGYSTNFVGCTYGEVYVYASCPGGTGGVSGVGYYDSNNTTINVLLVCGGQACAGGIATSQGATPFDYNFVGDATGSALPLNNASWDFGDGIYSSGLNVNHTYSAPGIYVVSFETEDANGQLCYYTDTLHAQDCIDLSTIDATIACATVTDYVCGCDGVTYINACQAENWYGVPSWTPGYCGSGSCSGSIISYQNSTSPEYSFFPSISGTSPFTYNWDLGDGSSSTAYNPVHYYQNPGTFVVTLNSVDANGYQCTYTDTLFVTASNTSCDSTFGAYNWQGLTHLYTYQDSLDIATINWDLGNGQTSTSLNPVVNYPNGTYYICMTLTTINGQTCSSCDYITVTNGSQTSSCSGGISATPGATPFEYNFVANLTGSVLPMINTIWYFGDGTNATGSNASHTYATPGTYVVAFGSVDANGYQCAYSDTIYVQNCIDPNSMDSTFVCSTVIDPVCGCDGVTYYNSCEAENWYGVTSWTQGSCVSSCTGGIDATLNAIYPGYSNYTLTAIVNGALSYYWDLGDGTISTLPYLDHNFQNGGTYLVTLIVTDLNSNQCTYTYTINTPVNTGCDSTFGYYNWQGLTYFYTSYDSLNTATASWDFGNGQTSTSLNPIVNFTTGTYNVCLTITTASGQTCTSCELITISVTPSCLDWSIIDFSATCPGYVPVCGCDGVTYDNECIAYNCFGVTTWTPGPCSGGNNGGGGTPADSTCTTTAGFQYYGQQGPFGFDIYFFGSGTSDIPGALDYYWEFGDGTYAGGINATHTFSDSIGVDSINAYTVCLTVTDSIACETTVCETIVLDTNPNGNISGGVFAASPRPGQDVYVGRSGSGDPMPNVTVRLLSPDGQLLATDVTDVDGLYDFGGLLFGDYIVKIDMPGINHAGEPVKLTPIVQTIPDLEFEVDNDGEVSTSIELVQFVNAFTVSPNPADDHLIMTLDMVASANTTISITNLLGQTIHREQLTLNKGTQSMRFEVDHLTAGIYLVSVQSGREIITKKILKN